MTDSHDVPAVTPSEAQGGPTAEPEHLKLIQGVVDRLAGESAHLKTWSVTITAGLILLARTSGHPHQGFWGLIPLFILAVQDAYYLGAERAYRRLYNRVSGPLEGEQRVRLWSLTALEGVNRWKNYGACLKDGFGPSVVVVHLALMGALSAASAFPSVLPPGR